METLTKAEERVMQILWKLKKGFVKEVIEQMNEDPKPSYNTISTIVRILETKGFVGHKAYGRTHEYYPSISKTAYRKMVFSQMLKSYFDGSYQSVVSYMVADEDISDEEISQIKKLIDQDPNEPQSRQ